MMNMKKGIHMSKDALRVVAAAGVLSVVWVWGVFDAGSGNAGASDGAPPRLRRLPDRRRMRRS